MATKPSTTEIREVTAETTTLDANERTHCCGAYTTFSIALSDEACECCRACYREVIRYY